MFHNEVNRRSYVASGDLSGLYLHAVDLIGGANFKVGVAAAQGGFGILLNKPKHGEAASVAVEGQQEFRAGAAVAAGDYVTSAASGWVVTVSSTTNASQLGRCVVGCASGMIGVVELVPVKAPTA